jgi:hypothetical protein
MYGSSPPPTRGNSRSYRDPMATQSSTLSGITAMARFL